jgi:Ca-activated chloride channel family protein
MDGADAVAKKRIGIGRVRAASRARSLGFAVLLSAVLLCSQLASFSFSQTPEYIYSVSVDRVILDISVRGSEGQLIRGLPQESFHVYEDGQLQKIKSFENEDLPLAVGLVIDNSRSMRPKRAEVVRAALAFIESSNPGDEMFVVNFDDAPELALPLGRAFSNDAAELKTALTGNDADGRTALYDAIVMGMDHLRAAHLERRVLVVISDGGDNASRHTLQQALTAVRNSNVSIYSIAISDPDAMEQNVTVLKRFSGESGGEFFIQPSLKEIGRICRQIAGNIRIQYTLTYSPANKAHDGSYRKIRVVVDAPRMGKVSILTRPGYLAPSDRASKKSAQGKNQEREHP